MKRRSCKYLLTAALLCAALTLPAKAARRRVPVQADAIPVSAAAYVERCRPAFGEKAFQAMLDFTREAVAYVPTVIMTVVDNMPAEEIEACRKICEGLGATYRVRHYSTNW